MTRPPLIAIVDDDPSVRRSLHRLLRSVGYTVATFASAVEYLDSLVRRHTDCLVLDAHLDGMSGFELQHRLVTDGARVPIIFITAHDDALTRERMEKAGAADHLWKPFDDRALLDAIGKALGTDRAH